jgi:hypothetical protein
MTFLVIHQSIAEQIVVEYGDRAGAEDCAQFLTRTQGGATKVYAAFVIGSYFQHRDLPVEPAPPCIVCGAPEDAHDAGCMCAEEAL